MNYKKIGLLYFTYAAIVAVLIQRVILPYILPHLHAGNGFLRQLDCPTFHNAAVQTAAAIKFHGWSAWQVRPGDIGSAGIAAIVYALTVPELWAMIPVNAFVHALSGVIIIAITNRVVNNFNMAALCSLPFILFPSSATWYAQIHQDGFTILGWLLLFYAWVVAFDHNLSEKNILYKSLVKIFVCISIGYYLMWAMRPYHTRFYSILSTLFLVCSFVFFIGRSIFVKKILWQQITTLLFILLLSLGMKFIVAGYRVWWEGIPVQAAEKYSSDSSVASDTASGTGTASVAASGTGTASVTPSKTSSYGIINELGHKNDRNSMVQKEIETRFFNIAERFDPAATDYFFISRLVRELNNNRVVFASYAQYSGAASNIDLHVSLDSVSEFIAYIPRAYQIALLAPFPNSWFKAGSNESNTMMRRISVVEMTVIYIGLLGLPFVIYYYYQSMVLWLIILANFSIILPIAIAIPNVGTIYRMRYGFLMMILALSLAGLFSFYERMFNKRSKIARATH